MNTPTLNIQYTNFKSLVRATLSVGEARIPCENTKGLVFHDKHLITASDALARFPTLKKAIPGLQIKRSF